jgi:type IV pilus assembly protein PilX
MTRKMAIPSRQRGAALAIGLILLLILTLLAVTGMNTSSMELVMAGNEQYRQKAFQASEAGIEHALTKLATLDQNCAPPKQILDEQVPNTPGDRYVVTAQYKGEGAAPGDSTGQFTAFHYQIVSTGTSVRNANAEHTQGAFKVQSTGEGMSFGCPPTSP